MIYCMIWIPVGEEESWSSSVRCDLSIERIWNAKAESFKQLSFAFCLSHRHVYQSTGQPSLDRSYRRPRIFPQKVVVSTLYALRLNCSPGKGVPIHVLS